MRARTAISFPSPLLPPARRGAARPSTRSSLARAGRGDASRPHGDHRLHGAQHPRRQAGTREVWDADDAIAAVAGSFRILAQGVAQDGFQIADERESRLWGFVKLRQYPGANRPRLAIDTASAVWRPGPVEGSELLALYRDPAPGEGHAGLARMAPGCGWGRDLRPGGEEVFVVEGVLEDEHGQHGMGSWLRHWRGGAHRWHSPEGCLLYVKQ